MSEAIKELDKLDVISKGFDINKKIEIKGGKAVSVSRRILEALKNSMLEANKWIDDTFFYGDEVEEKEQEEIAKEESPKEEKITVELSEEKEPSHTPEQELFIVERYIKTFEKKLEEAIQKNDLEGQEKYRGLLAEKQAEASQIKKSMGKSEDKIEIDKKELDELNYLKNEKQKVEEEILKHQRGDEQVFSIAAQYPGATEESLRSYLNNLKNKIESLEELIASKETYVAPSEEAAAKESYKINNKGEIVLDDGKEDLVSDVENDWSRKAEEKEVEASEAPHLPEDELEERRVEDDEAVERTDSIESKEASQELSSDYHALMQERAEVQSELDKLKDVYFSDEKEQLRNYLLEIDQRLDDLEAKEQAQVEPQPKTEDKEAIYNQYQSLMKEREAIEIELDKLKDVYFSEEKEKLQNKLKKVNDEIVKTTVKMVPDISEVESDYYSLEEEEKEAAATADEDLEEMLVRLEHLADVLSETIESVRHKLYGQEEVKEK